jgi:SAM-dependent methyltransferase
MSAPHATWADWILPLRHICPRCGAPIEIIDGPVAALCVKCGFQAMRVDAVVSFLPRSSSEKWQQFYEATAEGHKGDTTSGVGYKFPIQQRYLVEGFRKLCGERSVGEAILDIGCGNGLFWQALFGNRAAVGVDFSLRMCLLAQARGMRVYQADATALPFSEEQFDLVYSPEIVQCIEDLRTALSEMARVCRPNGRILVSTLNRTSLVRHAALRAWRLFHGPMTAKDNLPIRRRAGEVEELGRSLSLRLVKICWTHFPLPWRHYTHGTRYVLEPLASNMILEFARVSRH